MSTERIPISRQLPPFKTGGVFAVGGSIRLPAGAWSGAATLRNFDTGAEVAQLSVSVGADSADAPGSPRAIRIATSTDTSTWPAAFCVFDVLLTDAAQQKHYLPTFGVQLIRPQTTGGPA